MIQVTVRFQEKEISYLHISGHAESNQYGKDLVCAGVSAVVFGALNAIEHVDSFTISVGDDDVEITRKQKVSEHDCIVLEVLLKQLQTIEESYAKYIKITKERR